MHHLTWTSLSMFLRLHQHIKIYGKQRLPVKPPFVIVANHTSHLDALALGAALGMKCRGNISPLAAADTFFDTTMKAMLATYFLNATPVKRKKAASHSIRNMREQLENHEASYVLFPEGTRSRDGGLTHRNERDGDQEKGQSQPGTQRRHTLHLCPPIRLSQIHARFKGPVDDPQTRVRSRIVSPGSGSPAHQMDDRESACQWANRLR